MLDNTTFRFSARRAATVLGLSLLLVLMAACSDGDDDAAETTVPADEQATTEEASTEDPAPSTVDGTDDDGTTEDGADGTTDEDGTTEDGADEDGADVAAVGSPSAELVDRLAVALPATGDDQLVISDDDGRCAAEGLDGRLEPAVYERLVERIEANEGIQPEDDFGSDDIDIVSDVFAQCLDLSSLIQAASADFRLGFDGSELFDCVAAENGSDGLEAAVLYEILADELDFGAGHLTTIGLDVCPEEGRAYLVQEVIFWVDPQSGPELTDCLSAAPVEAYQQLNEDGGPFATEVTSAFVGEHCPDYDLS